MTLETEPGPSEANVDNEARRLVVLRALDVFESLPESHFDAVCSLAQSFFSVPTTLISLVEQDRQWFKAKCGFEATETSRDVSFCAHAIQHDDVLVIENATCDPRFSDNPIVVGAPYIRFYAGAPLTLEPGIRVGTICLIDYTPRSFTPADCRKLEEFAMIVVGQLRQQKLAVEQKSNRRRFHESEARYSTLAASLPQMIWVSNSADGCLTFVNKQFCDFQGSDGLQDEEPVIVHFPDDYERVKQQHIESRLAGQDFSYESRLRRHDGVYLWHKIVSTPLYVNGTVSEWITTALDVNNIIVKRQEIQEATDLLKIAVDAAGAARWDYDPRSQQFTLSKEAALMHGVDSLGPVDLALDRWQALVQTNSANIIQQLRRASSDLAAEVAGEFQITHPDGTTKWLNSFGRAHVNVTDGRTNVVGLVFDVTDRRLSEAALISASLEATRARLEAEQANSVKSEFLARMSHEIRTPLNCIIGFSDLILDSYKDDHILGHRLRLIQRDGEVLLTVVNDILDFSMMESGEIKLSATPISLPELVGSVADILSGIAQQKGIELRLELQQGLPEFVTGDEKRLRQVLLNLAGNAVKFTDTGFASIRVDCESVSDQHVRVRFFVEDSGIGILPSRQSGLFKQFSQIDGSITRRFGGSGLGLVICKQIVEAMGGDIGMESRAGGGSTFWFVLSLPVAEFTHLRPQETKALYSGHTQLKLLLVEDLEVNQELIKAVLEGLGHQIDVASNGAEAIEMIQSVRYDLVFMDIQMPVVDGLTATRAIRNSDHESRAVPIIAMTANVLPKQIIAFKDAGMDDHVGKPFKLAEIVSVIARWVGPAHGENSAASGV
ncbi:GAF domain-containing hybrid sensor histidine kinase/response regulator [Tardiphaga sp. vice278]|uniref:GAF domain-containing hybrid sensor histidine kinase/response regulator n=1 Tax=Tardiphaga sp. vice278 TaxID=2592815 RepID=UPI0011652A10|nr:GAF domain-containing hybrid sensor histidine kinase/response regulator [Tardiphaga sp. vice278]QDM15705.1 response regulator [Tardiphaga sp. vice278]